MLEFKVITLITMLFGYAKGVDLRLNGEFVKNIESWASVSILSTKADILDDSYTDMKAIP